MNYETLFTNTDIIHGRNFTLRRFDHSGSVRLNSTERYPMLFVLKGTLLIFSNSSKYKKIAGEMILLDKQQCRDVFCTPGMILLEYDLPAELTRHFETISTEYCTPRIPITGRLEEWVEELLTCKPNKENSESEGLVGMLLKYQSRRLKTLCGPMKHYFEELKWREWKNRNPTIIEERSTR